MAQSTQRAVSDGTLVSLDLSINYLDRSEIAVYFDAVLTTAWAWVGETAKQITFSPAVPNGVEVLVKRTTDISKLRHEFSKGAAFTAEVLDEDLTQVLHIAQEASEANLSGQFYSDIDMHNYRIRNIGTAVDDTDALTLGQYKADADGAFNSKAAAAASASAAAGSATAAAGSATSAAGSATAAANSATAAAGSATAAATSATNAANASRLTAGTVTTGAAGSSAAVSITGSAGSQVLNLTIPRGDVGPQGVQGIQGVKGDKGDKGDTGDTGATGPAGPANTLAIGTVTSGASAAATITGTSPNQTLNLTLPKGDKGDTGNTGATGPANSLSIGTVTASAPGGAASATITGTAPTQTLNLVIPRGETGPQGPQGEVGPQGPAGSGSGDVLGPGAAVTADALAQWSGTTGTNIKAVTFSGLVKLASGVPSAAVAGTDYVIPSGNVATATALATARTLTIGSTGKSFNGSANVSWSLAEIGAQAADADLTAIAALAGTSGLLRKTAANTWALDTAAYITGNQTITYTGDVTGSGTTAVTLTLANSGVTAGTYNDSATAVRPFTVDAKGRVTGVGTAVTITPAWGSITGKPTTLAGFGITDGQPLDADLTAIAALAGTSGLLRKTAANTWSLETTAYAPLASPALTGTPTAPTAAAKVNTTQVATTAFADRLRSFLTGITSGTPTSADRGCLLPVTAGITIPASVFAAGDTFSIYNNSAASITLTQGSGLTLRLGGTATTGNRTLAQRGIATVVFISATEAVIGGMGLT